MTWQKKIYTVGPYVLVGTLGGVGGLLYDHCGNDTTGVKALQEAGVVEVPRDGGLEDCLNENRRLGSFNKTLQRQYQQSVDELGRGITNQCQTYTDQLKQITDLLEGCSEDAPDGGASDISDGGVLDTGQASDGGKTSSNEECTRRCPKCPDIRKL